MAAKSKVSKLFTAGNRAARMRRSTVASFTIDQFQFDQPQKVSGMIDAFA